MRADDVIVALDQRFRACHGRIVAALTRRFGVQRFARIENAAVQDAYVRALERWPSEGTPTEPERWLVRVAHNAMIDALRRELPMRPLDESHEASVDPPTLESDDELRLMFLCSDPALTRAAQIALMLNVTFGLTAGQIATAFVTDERTVAQRLVRAKKRLRDDGVQFDVPEPRASTRRTMMPRSTRDSATKPSGSYACSQRRSRRPSPRRLRCEPCCVFTPPASRPVWLTTAACS